MLALHLPTACRGRCKVGQTLAICPRICQIITQGRAGSLTSNLRMKYETEMLVIIFTGSGEDIKMNKQSHSGKKQRGEERDPWDRQEPWGPADLGDKALRSSSGSCAGTFLFRP